MKKKRLKEKKTREIVSGQWNGQRAYHSFRIAMAPIFYDGWRQRRSTLQSLISKGTKVQIAMNQECNISKKSTLLHRGIASENIDKGRLWLYVLLTCADSMMNGLSAHKMELWRRACVLFHIRGDHAMLPWLKI